MTDRASASTSRCQRPIRPPDRDEHDDEEDEPQPGRGPLRAERLLQEAGQDVPGPRLGLEVEVTAAAAIDRELRDLAARGYTIPIRVVSLHA